VNASTLGNGAIQGLTSVAYGGALLVSNLAGTLASGQAYPIFNSASATGNFSGISPNPGNFLRWRFVPASGVLSVVSSLLQPIIASITLSANSTVLLVTNGPPGGTAYLRASTNVSLPLPSWPTLATNSFDLSGSLAWTNPIAPGAGGRFYRIAVPRLP